MDAARKLWRICAMTIIAQNPAFCNVLLDFAVLFGCFALFLKTAAPGESGSLFLRSGKVMSVIHTINRRTVNSLRINAVFNAR